MTMMTMMGCMRWRVCPRLTRFLSTASASATTSSAASSNSSLFVMPKTPIPLFQRGVEPAQLTTTDLFSNKRVAIFGVPGAFTPVCSTKHVPSFLKNIDGLKTAGVDTIACISVNDPFVMEAWADNLGAKGKILFLADPDGAFSRLVGVETDLSVAGLGKRSKRYSMFVVNGEVKHLNVEMPGEFETTSAEYLLQQIQSS